MALARTDGQSGWSSQPSQVCFQFCENLFLQAPVLAARVPSPGAGLSADRPQTQGTTEPQRVYPAFPGCGPPSYPISSLSELTTSETQWAPLQGGSLTPAPLPSRQVQYASSQAWGCAGCISLAPQALPLPSSVRGFSQAKPIS